MDFDLTEEQRMLKDMAYKFAVTEFKPVSQECDEQEKYTPEIRKKLAKTVWSAPGSRKSMAAPEPASWQLPSSRKNSPRSIWASD